MGAIILFDGVCNLCNHIVQFVIKRDKHAYFKFASLQSEAGQTLLEKYKVDPKTDSIVLIEQDECYMKSSAALRVGKKLTGVWKAFFIFIIIPPVIRDKVYDLIARNRYNWFGKRDSCMLPSPEMKKRFIQ
ncbi:thiol-disulfide oxidoreductase DCC family protein [Rossellomorea vietnamensis]|uniref:Thiol-disulfide oxidoreductase DCC family protein n=1 Tax=Rossellomorea vietnamensis TaxID=218284 RepID=A0A5D4NUM9_9BACI|nr:thiol-disulfide oxidoreductase DCC family protein [Rossellomorea vietnamensis]TYS17579.1 thiol-disulfide oxidoreductase DCC family protein [Rossellomorea vietnamensis]